MWVRDGHVCSVEEVTMVVMVVVMWRERIVIGIMERVKGEDINEDAVILRHP